MREYHDDEGWGVIDAPGVPGGCWVHFSAIAAQGYRSLRTGRPVAFHSTPADQDGYRFMALKVWPAGRPEPAFPPHDPPGSAYASDVTVTYD